MCDYDKMFNRHLIDLSISSSINQEQLFKYVANCLMEQKMVKCDYLNQLMEREKRFPTGLKTQYVNIALPHADCDYVEKPFIYIARLKQPVVFRQMGDNQKMMVKNLFFLGIKEPQRQVGLLQKLLHLFLEQSFVNAFLRADTNNQMYQLMLDQIKK